MAEWTKEELIEFILKTLSIPTLTPILKHHITTLVIEHELSYKEIARALHYKYVVKGETYNSTYGIKNILNIIHDANKYYDAEKKRIQAQKESVERANAKPDILLTVNRTQKRKKLRTIDITSLELDNED